MPNAPPKPPVTPEPPFRFAPGFADCIADVASNWAALEYTINSCIWALSGMPPAIGACLTSQIMSMPGRLAALLALMKLRRMHIRLIRKVNKFAADIRNPNELRNRIIHDQWVNSAKYPEQMGRIEIVAPQTLSMEIKDVTLKELLADAEKINRSRQVFQQIGYEIMTALQSLPEMSQTELVPIVGIPLDPQNPANTPK